MRETSQPTRRTSKKSVSREARRSRSDAESRFYTIDNTEDIYGTQLLPSQRSYIDPWDLENYDYVRSKIDHSSSPSSYYSLAVGPSNDYAAHKYVRNSSPSNYYSHYDLDCCSGPCTEAMYDSGSGCIPDYYRDEESDFEIFPGEYSSSCSSPEQMTSLRSPYAYCNPYASLRPFASGCYDCNLDALPCPSLIYDKCMVGGISSLYSNSGSYSLKQTSTSSLYDGIYSQRFGLSKKGLLQIDYSCSWNELDRVMGRHY